MFLERVFMEKKLTVAEIRTLDLSAEFSSLHCSFSHLDCPSSGQLSVGLDNFSSNFESMIQTNARLT